MENTGSKMSEHDFEMLIERLKNEIVERTWAEKRARDAMDYAESIVDSVRHPLVVLDQNLKVVSANVAFYYLFSLTRTDTVGRELLEVGNGRLDVPQVAAAVKDIKTPPRSIEIDAEFPLVGRKRLLIRAENLQYNVKHLDFILLIIEDVTEFRANELRLETSLREQETLAQEMSHRIKNNLQLLASILALQAACIDEAASRNAIIECRTRVLAMSLIHENLYYEGRVEEVDLLDQLGRLARSVTESFSGPTVALKVEGSQVRVSPDLAIYVNLAVNEMLTNSFKHGFVGVEDPSLEIAVGTRDRNTIEIHVADNGQGFQTGKAPPRSDQSLGFRLIQNIVEGQLGGTWSVAGGDRGVVHTLSFKLMS